MEDSEVDKLKKELSQARALNNNLNDAFQALQTEKRTKSNIDFVQLQRSEMRLIAELGAKSSTALDVLMTLGQAMDKSNAVMMSYETMSLITGKSRSTLSQAISLLKEDNWIETIKVGTANAYVLNSAVLWTDRGNKKFTAFSAQIITTLDEQTKDVRETPNVKLKRIPMLQPNERGVLNDEKLPPPDQEDMDLN